MSGWNLPPGVSVHDIPGNEVDDDGDFCNHCGSDLRPQSPESLKAQLDELLTAPLHRVLELRANHRNKRCE